MILDKNKILSSRVGKAVEISFSTVFPSTAFEGHLDHQNNVFRRFLLLVSRFRPLKKVNFFLVYNCITLAANVSSPLHIPLVLHTLICFFLKF